jgi:Fic family protein
MLASITTEVPARIATRRVGLPPGLAERCRYIESEISRVDGRHGGVLSGLTTFLIGSESVASSRIEHVYAGLDEVARASIREESSAAARMVAAAADAMITLLDGQRVGWPCRVESVLEAHCVLLAGDLFEGGNAGGFRRVQDWLGGSGFSPRGALHVPPPAGEVGSLMRDLVWFVSRDDVPPLAQAALAHGQFEAIHPFTDGNGRIGRGLIGLTLRRRGVARRIVVPVAAAMLASVDAYFAALAAYRGGDAGVLVSYVAGAAETATLEAGVSAERLAGMLSRWREVVRPRRSSSADRLLAGLLERPVLSARIAREVTGSSVPRTYAAIERLRAAGVLREVTGGGRDRVWVAGDVLAELADLEDRIGRRTAPPRRWR